MTTQSLIRRSEYHDSVTLMLVARELLNLPGVLDAAVVMGTEANKGILAEADLLLLPAPPSARRVTLWMALSPSSSKYQHGCCTASRTI